MDLRNHAQLEHEVSVAKALAETLRANGQSADSEQVEEFIRCAREENLLIGVAGASKRGKSTLVNALLGRQDDMLAPIGRFPATNVVSMFTRGPQLRVRVHVDGQSNQPIVIRPEEVRQYACEEGNPGNAKRVERLEIEGPFEGLDDHIGLIDLPGADNALASQHGEILFRSLSMVQAIIFLVSADDPINAAEQELLRLVRKSDAGRFIFVLNKCDLVEQGELTESELQEGLAHNRDILAAVGFEGHQILQVSALKAMRGEADSGLAQLISAIRASIAANRLDLVAGSLHARVEAIRTVALQRAREELAISQLGESELISLQDQVSATRGQLSSGKQERARLFRSEFTEALRDLDDSTDRLTSKLRRDFESLIDSKGDAEIPALALSIHADVESSLRDGLRDPLARCQGALDQASEELAASSPRLGIPNPKAPAPAATIGSQLKDSLAVPMAAGPGAVLGGFSMALPALLGGAMTAAAGGSTIAGIVGGAAQFMVLPLLSVFTVPIGLAGLGWAAFRGFRAFQLEKLKDRNALKNAIGQMLDEVRTGVRDETHRLRGELPSRLDEHFKSQEKCLASLSDELQQRLKSRPTPAQLERLESNTLRLEALSSPPALVTSGA